MVSNILKAPASSTKENGWKSLIGDEPCKCFSLGKSMTKSSDRTKEKYMGEKEQHTTAA